jgi:hypothetical protein
MENLLPILIGIVWIAYTLYSRGQKKKNMNSPQAGENQKAKPLSLLEQILMGEEIKPPQSFTNYFENEEPEPVILPVEKKEIIRKSPPPFLNEEFSNFFQEGQSVSEFYEPVKTIEEILHEHTEEIEERDFDLRKAVIYSEIINAPYIDYK